MTNTEGLRTVRATKVTATPLREGWESVRKGLPFDYDACDRLGRVWAINYETGRIQAINVRTAGLPLPTWRKGSLAPEATLKARHTAEQLTGPATCHKCNAVKAAAAAAAASA